MLENLIGFTKTSTILTGNQVAKLIATDGTGSDQFGESAAMSATGSVLIIGASADDDKGSNSGSAYIFKQDGANWTQVSKIVAADGAVSDAFGAAVDISSDGATCIISSHLDDDKGAASGSAYIYKNTSGNTWEQAAKLVPSDGAASDQFSFALSMSGSGTVCAIGSRYDSDKGIRSGSVYIFRNITGATWDQVAKIVPTDGAANDNFGAAVAISDDGSTVAIGAQYDNPRGTYSGSVYVFKNTTGDTWAQVAKLSASDGVAYDQFGEYVAISGDGKVILSSALRDADNGALSGSSYLFRNTSGNTWVQEHKFIAFDGSAYMEYGRWPSLTTDGNVCMVGSWKDNAKGTQAGAVYIYQKKETWSLINKVVDAAGIDYYYFGMATALAGDGSLGLIGSGGPGGDGNNKGAAFVFN